MNLEILSSDKPKPGRLYRCTFRPNCSTMLKQGDFGIGTLPVYGSQPSSSHILFHREAVLCLRCDLLSWARCHAGELNLSRVVVLSDRSLVISVAAWTLAMTRRRPRQRCCPPLACPMAWPGTPRGSACISMKQCPKPSSYTRQTRLECQLGNCLLLLLLITPCLLESNFSRTRGL